MNHRQSLPFFMAALVLVAGSANGPTAAAAQSASRVNVYQYAMDNPVDDAKLSSAPTLGESVPRSIKLTPLDGDAAYAYFYYQGRPVIVDVSTRSVVRIGN